MGSEPDPSRCGRLAGRLMAGVLWSPLSVAVDHTWTVVTVAGPGSDSPHTVVVRYAVGPRHVWVWPGDPEHTTWWRGLRSPGRVTLRRGGRTVTGLARVVDGAVELGEAARGLAVYAQRFPRTARGIVGGELTSSHLLQAAATTVWVRIDVDDTTLRVDHDPATALAFGLGRLRRRRLGSCPAPMVVVGGPPARPAPWAPDLGERPLQPRVPQRRADRAFWPAPRPHAGRTTGQPSNSSAALASSALTGA